MRMKRTIVYLFGTGATIGELDKQGYYCDLDMSSIGDAVLKRSGSLNGPYWRLHQQISIPTGTDIELIISLLEGFAGSGDITYKPICEELRLLFKEHVCSQVDVSIKPKISAVILNLHKKYGEYMGRGGEELAGIMTVNYDSLLEAAFSAIYGGINCCVNFRSSQYKCVKSAPVLLKLHGSFNWKITSPPLFNCRTLEITSSSSSEESNTGWMPPSVYKKPSGAIFEKIWNGASDLLSRCDILRVVGSSLRKEDCALISLLFSSRIKNKKMEIQLIVPEKDATGDAGIMDRLQLLGDMKYVSSLDEYDKDLDVNKNTYYNWVQMKLSEADKNGAGLSDVDLYDGILEGIK